MAGVDPGDRRPRPRGERLLRLEREDVVPLRDQVGGRQRAPRYLGDRVAERPDGLRPERGRGGVRLVVGQVVVEQVLGRLAGDAGRREVALDVPPGRADPADPGEQRLALVEDEGRDVDDVDDAGQRRQGTSARGARGASSSRDARSKLMSQLIDVIAKVFFMT